MLCAATRSTSIKPDAVFKALDTGHFAAVLGLLDFDVKDDVAGPGSVMSL